MQEKLDSIKAVLEYYAYPGHKNNNSERYAQEGLTTLQELSAKLREQIEPPQCQREEGHKFEASIVFGDVGWQCIHCMLWVSDLPTPPKKEKADA